MNRKKTLAFHTLGCKLNFSETDTIARHARENGHRTVGFDEAAGTYVIHSCTVTQKAEKRCRDLIKKVRKLQPDARIVVMGCYSQVRAAELQKIPGVSLVLDNAEKFDLLTHLDDTDGRDHASIEPPTPSAAFIPAYSTQGRTRTFFKIQDGCDHRCAYCTIPLARGRSRSNSIEETLQLARSIAQKGTREVVLTGVNIGDFGKHHGETLFELLEQLTKTAGLPRIRLSSIEPELLDDDIIGLVAREPALMPHFHLPVQSGSNVVLESMDRRYSTGLVSDRIQAIREKMPLACIAADIIAGYPGETEELFRESCEFLKNADISYLHVFPFSERENTRAAKIPGKVPPNERKRRARLLQELSQEKKKQFIARSVNTTSKVLWEKQAKNGYLYGFTENYLKARTSHHPERENAIERVRLTTTDASGTFIIQNRTTPST